MLYPIKLGAVLLALLFVGCAAIPPPPVSVPIVPPLKLVQNCELVRPPNVQLYTLASAEKKEELLYTFSLAQMDAVVLCNKRQESLRVWLSEQQRLYLSNAN